MFADPPKSKDIIYPERFHQGCLFCWQPVKRQGKNIRLKIPGPGKLQGIRSYLPRGIPADNCFFLFFKRGRGLAPVSITNEHSYRNIRTGRRYGWVSCVRCGDDKDYFVREFLWWRKRKKGSEWLLFPGFPPPVPPSLL